MHTWHPLPASNRTTRTSTHNQQKADSMSNDPWAAAQVAQPAGTPATAGGQGSSQAAKQFALDPSANPFATPDAVGGGGGIRGPRWVDILDRLIVLEPVEKLLGQPVPEQPNQTQDFYKANLTVLDGGTLTVVTPERPAKGDQPALPEQTNDYEPPFTFPSWYAYGKAITVKLDGIQKAGIPLLLGVVKRCPTGPGYRKGLTWKDSTREWDSYVEKLRKDPARAGAKPQYSWGLIDPSPEQQEQALTWFREQQANATVSQ